MKNRENNGKDGLRIVKKTPVRYKKRLEKSRAFVANKRRAKYKDLKSKPCYDCKLAYDPVCMDFDHLDEATKIAPVATLIRNGATEKQVSDEIAKCQLVCANCLRLRTKLRHQFKQVGYKKGTHVLAYIAHPVGTDPDERKYNLENVQKWFLWLLDRTDFAFNVPWFIYVSNLDETHRERAMRDDLKNLDRCDILILTGGKISKGMAVEATLAQQKGIKIIDLTSVGYSPVDTAIELIPVEYRK